MLKISENKITKKAVTLRLEGRIVGPWVDELKQACEPLVQSGSRLTLDLADVSFVDEPGVAALTGLSAQGTKLLNITPFVDKQLKAG